MTTDLERDLRTRLNTSADATPIDLDLDAILDEGGDRLRARTRRRTAVAGSLAALAVVAGSIGAHAMRGSTSTPAHVPSSGDTALLGRTVTLDTSQAQSGEPMSLVVRVTSADPDGAIGLTVTPRDAHGKALHAPVPATLAAGQSSVLLRGLPLCRLCLVGVIRGTAESLATVSPEGPVADSAVGTAGTGPVPVGDGSLTVMAEWEKDDGPTRRATGQQIAHVSGLLWRTADWTIHDSTGAALPSVSFQSNDRTYVVFRATRYGVVGVAEESGWTSWPEATLRKEAPGSGYSGGQGEQSMSMTLLPAGSTIHSAVWKHAKGQQQAVKDLPGLGRVALMTADADNAKDIAELVRFTYRTPAGKLVTVEEAGR